MTTLEKYKKLEIEMHGEKILIIGQGLAGSILSYEFLKAGADIHILNLEKKDTSSAKAAGLYNPITGRKMVKTWLADELFPGLENYYREISGFLGKEIVFPRPIYRPFISVEERNDWEGRAGDPSFASFVNQVHTRSLGVPGLQDRHGGVQLKYTGSVDLPEMIHLFRQYFKEKHIYTNGTFHSEGTSQYDKVIFCDGPDYHSSPYWAGLDFRLVKGEVLELRCDLPQGMVYNRGVFVLPKGGTFWVGSTYDHKTLDHVPSKAGRKDILQRFEKLYSGPYEVIGSWAGVRPATFDRRPFIGLHPDDARIGIFNGFGTKGVSLVPYFAKQMVNFCDKKQELLPDIDVRRMYQRK